jgi:hypothetical protein
MKECSIQFGQKSVFSRILFFVTGKYLNLMNANQLKHNDAFSVFKNIVKLFMGEGYEILICHLSCVTESGGEYIHMDIYQHISVLRQIASSISLSWKSN